MYIKSVNDMNNFMNPQDYGHLEFYAQAEGKHQQKPEIKVKSLKIVCT